MHSSFLAIGSAIFLLLQPAVAGGNMDSVDSSECPASCFTSTVTTSVPWVTATSTVTSQNSGVTATVTAPGETVTVTTTNPGLAVTVTVTDPGATLTVTAPGQPTTVYISTTIGGSIASATVDATTITISPVSASGNPEPWDNGTQTWSSDGGPHHSTATSSWEGVTTSTPASPSQTGSSVSANGTQTWTDDAEQHHHTSATGYWNGAIPSSSASPFNNGSATWAETTASEPTALQTSEGSATWSTATSTRGGVMTSSFPACTGVSTPVSIVTVTDTIVQTVTGYPPVSSTTDTSVNSWANQAARERKRRAASHNW